MDIEGDAVILPIVIPEGWESGKAWAILAKDMNGFARVSPLFKTYEDAELCIISFGGRPAYPDEEA